MAAADEAAVAAEAAVTVNATNAMATVILRGTASPANREKNAAEKAVLSENNTTNQQQQ